MCGKPGNPAQHSRRDPLRWEGDKVFCGAFRTCEGDTPTWEVVASRRRPNGIQIWSPSCSWRAHSEVSAPAVYVVVVLHSFKG